MAVPKRIRVRRAHMEEDTGKLTHIAGGASLVDYNRAGVPLLEIVSEPDLRSAEETEAYARKLRSILRYLGVNNGDMSKGILRFEANVSIMQPDDTEFRQRTEIKNLNSIRNMVKAIDVEVQRQIKLYSDGDTVKPATLGWDENRQTIVIQRYKERADEYRYFPEPDLPIVEVSREWVARLQAQLPELPDQLQERFTSEYGLSTYDAGVLVAESAIAQYFEVIVKAGIDAKTTANWITGDLFSLLNNHNVEREHIAETNIPAENFAGLLKLVADGKINANTAKSKVLPAMWEMGKDAPTIVDEQGLAQISDTSEIASMVSQAVADNANMVERYLAGEDKLFNALFGRIMSALKGKGNPQVVREQLQEQLDEMK